MLNIRHLNYGAVEILDFDISSITIETALELRDILRKELIVVIRKQQTEPLNFAKLIHYMGNICNWSQCKWDLEGNSIQENSKYPDIENWDHTKPFPVQRVAGEKRNGAFTGIFPLGKLDWHCNLNGPDRADGVALQGIKGVEGTRTSWLNTAVAFKEIPSELKNRIKGKYGTFYYNPTNWADIDNKKQLHIMLRNQKHYKMWIEQTNIAGVQGLYLYTNNDCEISGNDEALFVDLQNFLFQEKYMYHHDWSVGDIVLSDQLLTLHKRRIESDTIFENRVLNRLTFKISNIGNPPAFIEQNNIS